MRNVLATFAGFGDFDPVLIDVQSATRVSGLLQALAVHPDKDKLFAGDMANSDNYWPEAGAWDACYKPYVVKEGTLLVPVKGMLLHNFPYAVGSYATGYYYIQKAMERGVADPAVERIALVCDTPGGHVAGCFELVDRIYGMRSQKRIEAFAHEYAYSAGYAVASAAQKITMSKTGGIGSIGVVTMHADFSKALDDAGIKITFIYAGKHKVDGNPYEALSADAKARIQERIDASYSVFCQTVARNRNMPESKVRATEALTFGFEEGKARMLVDASAPLDDALSEFSKSPSEDEDEAETAMTLRTEAEQNAAVEAARKEGAEGAAAKAREEAVTAERARVSGIKGLDEAKKRPAATEACIEQGMDAATAKVFLAKLPEEAPAKATNSGDEGFQKKMDAAAPGPAADKEDEALETANTEDAKADALRDRILANTFGTAKAK